MTDSQPTECPGSGLLRALIAGTVDATEEARLQEHLCDCTTCQSALEYAATGNDTLIQDLSQFGASDEPTVLTTPLSKAISRFRAEIDGAKDTVVENISNDRAALSCLLSPASSPDVFGQLGPYEISDVIGQGGMGVVFKGTDPSLKRPVAIKVLAPGLAFNKSARARFVREAQSQAAVNHPNLVTIYEVSELSDDELPFLVMEFVQGESLQERIKRDGPLSIEDTARYGAEIAAGLAAAHEAGVIHRDIKPANVLIDAKTDTARITDFGLALAMDAIDDRITRPGVLAGTPAFMSPEQVAEESIDHRSDLFSFGSLLYLALTGTSPFHCNKHHEVLNKILAADVVPVRKLRPDAPQWLARVINRLHQTDPAARFQSAGEVQQALTSQSVTSGGPQRRSFRAVQWIAGTFLVLLVASVLLLRGGKSNSDVEPEDTSQQGTKQSTTTADTNSSDTTNEAKKADPFIVTKRGQLGMAIRSGETNLVVDSDGNFHIGAQTIAGEVSIRAAKDRTPHLIGTSRNTSGGQMFEVLPGSLLRLEGLTLVSKRVNANQHVDYIARINAGEIHASFCRFDVNAGKAGIFVSGESRVVLENCEMASPTRYGVSWRPTPRSEIEINNCIHHGDTFCSMLMGSSQTQLTPKASEVLPEHAARISIRNSILDTVNVFSINARSRNSGSPPTELSVMGSIMRHSGKKLRSLISVRTDRTFDNWQVSRRRINELIRWTGHSNVYQPSTAGTDAWILRWPDSTNAWAERNPRDWDQWWNIPEENQSFVSGVVYSHGQPHLPGKPRSRFGVDSALVGPEARSRANTK